MKYRTYTDTELRALLDCEPTNTEARDEAVARFCKTTFFSANDAADTRDASARYHLARAFDRVPRLRK